MKPNRDHIDWWGRRQQPWPHPVYVHERTPGFPTTGSCVGADWTKLPGVSAELIKHLWPEGDDDDQSDA